jgi:hypothetical protein
MDSIMFETSSSCGDLTALSNNTSPMKPLFAEHMAKHNASAAADATRNRNGNLIDTHKYRTKLCRNHMMGIRCPFEDRCVFAHGDEQVRPSSGLQTPTPEPVSMSPLSAPVLTAAAMTNNAALLAPPSPPACQAAPPALPSYENFMHSAVSASGVFSEPASPLESRPVTPPSTMPAQRELRFRYDPYVLGGIVFQ